MSYHDEPTYPPYPTSSTTQLNTPGAMNDRRSDIEKAYFSPVNSAIPIPRGPYSSGGGAPAYPPVRTFANPAPLGLCAFATTTFWLSLANIGADGLKVPNVVVGMGYAYGGFAQLLAGMWEFACGNTFGATAFTSYGAFWISFALILTPGTGIVDAYGTDTEELEHALGFFLAGFFILTTILLPGTLRASMGLVAVFVCLDVTFLLLTVGKFASTTTAAATWTKAGGIFGLVTAAMAWYTAAAALITRQTSYFSLPIGDLSRKD